MLLDCRYTNLVLGNSSVWQDKENQYQDIMLKNYSFDTSIVEIQNCWGTRQKDCELAVVRIDYQVSCNIWIEFVTGIPSQFEVFFITLPEFFPL